jgi:E3 ubiquitin-protein ligase SIAH1
MSPLLYNRSHGVEKIIESIQVPCSNTKYGCSVKTSYYERAGHETKCQYAPCFCPDTGCSFSASTGLLQEHFTTEHHWPSTKCRYGWCFYADVKEGVHVISSEDEQLFLLNIASEPFGCVISVFNVQPHDTEQKFRCAVSFGFWKNNSYHTQSSEFQVPSTTLSDGLPRDHYLFILPRFYIDEDSRICVTMKKDSAFQHEKTGTLGAQCYSPSFSFLVK